MNQYGRKNNKAAKDKNAYFKIFQRDLLRIVVHPPFLSDELDCGYDHDQPQQNPGDRHTVSHPEPNKTVLIDVERYGVGTVTRSSVREQKDGIKNLKRTDETSHDHEERRGRNKRYGDVYQLLPT